VTRPCMHITCTAGMVEKGKWRHSLTPTWYASGTQLTGRSSRYAAEGLKSASGRLALLRIELRFAAPRGGRSLTISADMLRGHFS